MAARPTRRLYQLNCNKSFHVLIMLARFLNRKESIPGSTAVGSWFRFHRSLYVSIPVPGIENQHRFQKLRIGIRNYRHWKDKKESKTIPKDTQAQRNWHDRKGVRLGVTTGRWCRRQSRGTIGWGWVSLLFTELTTSWRSRVAYPLARRDNAVWRA